MPEIEREGKGSREACEGAFLDLCSSRAWIDVSIREASRVESAAMTDPRGELWIADSPPHDSRTDLWPSPHTLPLFDMSQSFSSGELKLLEELVWSIAAASLCPWLLRSWQPASDADAPIEAASLDIWLGKSEACQHTTLRVQR